MKRILGLMVVAAGLFCVTGCGPKESPEEIQKTNAEIEQQQTEYYKSHPNADEPPKPTGSADMMNTSGQSGGPASGGPAPGN